jgi:hypothetical protein
MRASALFFTALSACALALSCSATSTGSHVGANGGTGAGGSGSGGTGAINPGTGGTGAINPGTGGTGAGTGSGGSGGACAGVTQKAQNTVLPADVIWTIDTSCSMTEETAQVRQNMNAFSNQIANAGVDIHIVLIAEQYQQLFPGLPVQGICIDAPLGSGQCPGDTNLPRFAHIFQTVGSTDSLSLILSTYPQWKAQLRPNSAKIFVSVTDDNSAMPAAEFTQKLNALDPNVIKSNLWKFDGIFCYSQCPSAATVGTVYKDLVTQTGGVSGDLCLQNFKPVFDALAKGVIGTALTCNWAIPPVPQGQTFNPGKVNVVFTDDSGTQHTLYKVKSQAECGPKGGWYYDDDNKPTTVIACPASCSEIKASKKGEVQVKFGCDTKVIPQ